MALNRIDFQMVAEERLLDAVLARLGPLRQDSGLDGDEAIGNVWRYRDWVINAFNFNMPYDHFVLQQIGGRGAAEVRSNCLEEVTTAPRRSPSA